MESDPKAVPVWPMPIIGTAILTMSLNDPNSLGRQGHVVQQYGERILVEWFSWVDGEPTFATWHTLHDATERRWRFFRSVEDANQYCERNNLKLTDAL